MERAVATTLRHELPQSVCLLSVFTVQCKVKQVKVIWKTVVVPAPRYSVRVPLIIMVADLAGSPPLRRPLACAGNYPPDHHSCLTIRAFSVQHVVIRS